MCTTQLLIYGYISHCILAGGSQGERRTKKSASAARLTCKKSHVVVMPVFTPDEAVKELHILCSSLSYLIVFTRQCITARTAGKMSVSMGERRREEESGGGGWGGTTNR